MIETGLAANNEATLAWSVSLHKTMRSCQRRAAFIHVVASAVSNDGLRRRAYVAKQLQGVSNWQGHLVHDVLAHEFLAEIRAHRRPTVAYLVGAAERLMEDQLAFSRAHRYRASDLSKTQAGRAYCALAVHEQGQDLDPQAMASVRMTIRRSFEYLLSQTDFIQVLQNGRNHQSEVNLWFSLAGSNVRGTVDLIFTDALGFLRIVDWKIAGSLTSDYSHQLRLYGLGVLRSGRWPGVEATSIRLIEANLLQGRITGHPLNEELIRATEDYAYKGIVQLRELVGRGRYEDLRLDELDVATTPRMCSNCSLSDICIETLISAGRTKDAEVVQGTLL